MSMVNLTFLGMDWKLMAVLDRVPLAERSECYRRLPCRWMG